MLIRSFVVAAIAASLVLPSCLFVKAPEAKVDVVNVALSPQPEIEMSDELVRTRQGDMIALLPKGWVFLDTKGETSSDVVAVAVDPDYTLSMVFSTVPSAESSKDQLDKEGLLGLARIAFAKHSRKTGGVAKLVGTYGTAELGPRKFGTYDFSTNAGSARTRCAVFTSSVGTHYEFALVPLTVSGKDVPPDAEIQRVFRSVLATIQY
ncbi:MAG TPA: hypothetical protein DIS79_09640 [Bacteroidetes bacterium]|nr:hypothetical protein [Bacteroidota bacterium]HRK05576.1 hypothetical protein [Chlorobiota bacterium]